MKQIGFVYDDSGRESAGYRGVADDCVVRAFCILTGADYREAYAEFAYAQSVLGSEGKRQRSARNGISKTARDSVFAAHGLVKQKLPKGPRPTYTEAHDRFGDCIVSTRGHVAALVDGALRDTFDGRGYWFDPVFEVNVGSDPQDKPDCGYAESRRNGVTTRHPGDRAEWRERKAMSVWTLPEKR